MKSKVLSYFTALTCRVLDLIYPRLCYGCRIPLVVQDTRYLCFKCWRRISFIREGSCLRCGIPLGKGMPSLSSCPLCKTQRFAFDETRAAIRYEGLGRDLLLDFKYHGKVELCYFFGALLSRRLQFAPFTSSPQLAISVPLSKKTERKRGYNQAHLIAKIVAKNLKIPYYNKILVKIKETAPQSTLDRKARKQNLIGAFSILSKEKFSKKEVLLVDDILTTGSTVDQCARILKKNGAKKVYVATVARSIPK